MGYLELMASPEASKQSYLAAVWGPAGFEGGDEAKTHQAALNRTDSPLQTPLFQNKLLNITSVLKISCIFQIQLLGGIQSISL